MGLDMYLSKKTYIGANYEHNNVKGSIELTTGENNTPVVVNFSRVSEIVESVAYWRKANQIHGWFVMNVQDGEDNCADYYVSREQLKELCEICKKVLDDKSLAAELLPTHSGFFFGGDGYDDYYFMDLQDTIDQLTPLILEESGEFYYKSSW